MVYEVYENDAVILCESLIAFLGWVSRLRIGISLGFVQQAGCQGMSWAKRFQDDCSLGFMAS